MVIVHHGERDQTRVGPTSAAPQKFAKLNAVEKVLVVKLAARVRRGVAIITFKVTNVPVQLAFCLLKEQC